MKRGFSVPLAHWFRNDLKDYFADRALSPGALSHEYLQKDTVRRYFDEHQKGLRDRSLILWYCLVFEVWLRLVKEGFRRPATSTCAKPPDARG